MKTDELKLNNFKSTIFALELNNFIFSALDLDNSRFGTFNDSKANDKS